MKAATIRVGGPWGITPFLTGKHEIMKYMKKLLEEGMDWFLIRRESPVGSSRRPEIKIHFMYFMISCFPVKMARLTHPFHRYGRLLRPKPFALSTTRNLRPCESDFKIRI